MPEPSRGKNAAFAPIMGVGPGANGCGARACERTTMSLDRTLVASATFGEAGRFRRPLYDSFCFARLPSTIEWLLTGDPALCGEILPTPAFAGLPTRYDTVVVLFVDAFGWHFFDRSSYDLPFLRRIVDRGAAVRLTSMFPSTTAAHVTCIHTGLPPGRSGVFEWFYYEPIAGTVIAPLTFTPAGLKVRGALRDMGWEPADLLPEPTYYHRLGGRGVETHIFQASSYTPSPYSDHVFRGRTAVHPYGTLAEGLTELVDVLLTQPERPRYCFWYADAIDHTGHVHGPDS